MSHPLTGIKVIDLTTFLSGPFCTMLLGDMGAEVIKIEEPKAGDPNRGNGPFIEGESAYFLYTNRNKKSMTLNIRSELGRKILLQLIKDADVFVENFRPQVKKKLEVDYANLIKINPRLIYCSISGFGQTGPWAERPGFDQIAQGMSGLMSVTGFPETGPTRVGVAIGDSICGIFAAYGILSALIERNKSGLGQFIETSLLEGLISILGFQAAKYFATGEVPLPQGNDHGTYAPYGTYKTKDGYINIATATQKMWEALCQILDMEELKDDPRFIQNDERVKNKKKLREIIEKKLAEKNSFEWIEILNEKGIPCGPINSIDMVFNDPQVIHQEMIMEVDHPKSKRIKMIGFPVKLRRTPPQIFLPPPLLGQHTKEILKKLNYSDEDIEEFKKNGVI